MDSRSEGKIENENILTNEQVKREKNCKRGKWIGLAVAVFVLLAVVLTAFFMYAHIAANSLGKSLITTLFPLIDLERRNSPH